MPAPRLMIVGAGKLGCYHLQGLAKLDQDAIIDIYDPSEASLERAKDHVDEIEHSSRHAIRYLTDPRELGDDYDLGINATTSGFRNDSIRKTGHLAKAWILEKILAQSVQQMDEIEDLLSGGQTAYVNHMMRELTWLRDAKNIIARQQVMSVETIGTNWSIACNALHHLDLAGWMSGGQLLALNTSELSEQWVPSKRQGYVETLGTLTAAFDDGVDVRLTSTAEDHHRLTTITTATTTWTIDVFTATISSDDGASFSGEFDRQSALTTRLAERVLAGQSLHLPALSYAAQTHRVYIAAMLAHWNKAMNKNDNAIPIT